MKTVQEEWLEFAEKIGLNRPEVHQVQRIEMRRAFYAGQWAYFQFAVNDAAALGEEAAQAALQERAVELRAFCEEVIRGSA